jgi:capsular polysaccharide biosynthesis protein
MRLLRVRWWTWVLVAGLVAGGAGGYWLCHHLNAKPSTSTSQVLVSGRFTDNQVDSSYTANQYVDQRMSTYAAVADSEEVTGPAARALRSDPATVAGEISATVVDGTTVLNLAVTGPTPVAAHDNGVAVTNAFVAAITRLESIGGESRVALSVITPSDLPPAVSLGSAGSWLFGGALAGAVLSGLVGLILRWLYPRWWSTPGPGEPEPRPGRQRRRRSPEDEGAEIMRHTGQPALDVHERAS